MKTFFAFDLDGTLTEVEVLPVIANELGLMDEMKSLTELTLAGQISFETSFRLRIAILKSIPISKVQEIVSDIPLNYSLVNFIKSHQDRCAVVTGNLDVWVSPLLKKLGCRVYSSHSVVNADQLCGVDYIMHKSHPIHELKSEFEKVICIGESMNDIPMFEVADSGIAFGGVHDPVKELIEISDYVVFEGEALCALLSTL